MVATGTVTLVQRPWWSLDLFLRYWVKADEDVPFWCHILLEGIMIASHIDTLKCKPNPAIVLGDDGILDVMTTMKVLPWSSMYATFGPASVDGRPLIFEVIFGSH
jgi:hypothetical protein